jgi:diadenosine tetraphosphate (Ap4A) HIT family hydrolase
MVRDRRFVAPIGQGGISRTSRILAVVTNDSPSNNALERTVSLDPQQPEKCELCASSSVLSENELAYVRPDNHSLSPGHVIAVPKRHVADFFEMTSQEQIAVLELLREAYQVVGAEHSADGYNIGVNIGTAAGQSRMHVHVHLIPRYFGDVPNPQGGVRCVLASR